MKAAYPNPFNPMVKLSFTMFVDNQASLVIYDVRGRRVAELLNESLTAGDHEVMWNGKTDTGEPAPAGVYFYSFKAGEYETTEKLLMLK
jgi:flagellar hook assembly protein FlgD